MHIANRNGIKAAPAGRNLLPAIEAGFVAIFQCRANRLPDVARAWFKESLDVRRNRSRKVTAAL